MLLSSFLYRLNQLAPGSKGAMSASGSRSALFSGSVYSKRQRGVTLVELVITIVIVSIAMVASLKSFSIISGRSSDSMIQSRTLDLAQIYMDEILAKNFDESTGVGGIPTYTGACRVTDDGESRGNYDDVDDFNVVNESPSFVDQNLSTLYANFNVVVNVSCDNSVGVNADGAKRIDIIISDPGGNQSRFSAYKGNF